MPIKILVELYATLPQLLGWSKKEIVLPDNATLGELFRRIHGLSEARKKYLARGWDLVILVNGRHHIFLGGMEAKLSDGDVVSIFPPSAGG